MYSSTCFGRPHAHHQELNNCSNSLWFNRWNVVIAVLLVVVGPAGRRDHDQPHCYHHAPTVKPEAATAVVELLMMGVRTPETCWAVHKRQVINLRNYCIWLDDLFEKWNILYSWLRKRKLPRNVSIKKLREKKASLKRIFFNINFFKILLSKKKSNALIRMMAHYSSRDLPTLILSCSTAVKSFNPLNAELNPICQLLALFGARPILHISRIRVNSSSL
jgi:hypothetical protein